MTVSEPQTSRISLCLFGAEWAVQRPYHHDFKFNNYLHGEATDRPPQIFGLGDGFNLADSGSTYSIQCAKCGIHGDFMVDGSLAFSIKNGITKGNVSPVNHDPFTIDAQFGITVEKRTNKAVKEISKQLAAFPLSPPTVPGMITLATEVSISAALDLTVNGRTELLVGGSLLIAPGTAALSLVHKEENKLEGQDVKFTPVAKVSHSIF